MAVNEFSSKLRLSTGSSLNSNSLLNKKHTETASTSSDIEWQWTSPTGTVPNVKLRAGKMPLQQMEKPCEAISPVSNNFPRKRKLIKNEEIVTEFGSSVHPDAALRYAPLCDPTVDTELVPEKNAYEGGPRSCKEDYSTMFDDGEDALEECLVQLSQTVEKNLSQNPKGIVPLVVTTPRSTRVHSALTKTSALIPSKAAVKQCRPTIQNDIRHVETKVVASSQSCSSSSLAPVRQGADPGSYKQTLHCPQAVHTHTALQKTLPVCENTTKYDIDDSFDDILVTFCEENVELLSQPATAEKHVPNKSHNPTNVVPNLQTSSRAESVSTKVPEPRRPIVSTRQILHQGAAVKSSNSVSFPVPKYEQTNCDKMFDDDFLQPDLLKLLESVEANSQPQPLPKVLHCTPEEIENKRRQAKMKLERKKIALKSGLVRT